MKHIGSLSFAGSLKMDPFVERPNPSYQQRAVNSEGHIHELLMEERRLRT
jgi:hypothetical protein